MSTSRQLAAILFADIEGYSALMQQDESRAMRLRDRFQKAIEEEVRIRSGRIVQISGDGALCIFKSAIEAVRSAISIQSRMRSEPRVPLRIGIHTGDIIVEGKDVFGDGVNVASRIQSLAVAGSVLISGKLNEEIRNQGDIMVVSLGNFQLKNIEQPVEVFAIRHESLVVPQKISQDAKGGRVTKKKTRSRNGWIATIAIIALIATLSFIFLRNRNTKEATTTTANLHIRTIAVLPFSNLSGQKDDEYFSDGICDEILTRLSKISQFNVLSRTSTLQFRGTNKTIKEIGTQLGADVILEGSVQKSKDKIRVNVQLIEVETDKHLWAETYDRELKDVFAIQSDIAKQIAEALNATYEEGLFASKPTENMEAFDAYLRANKLAEQFWDFTKMDKVPEAIKMYEQAIRLDPKFLEAYDGLVAIYVEVSFRQAVINSDDYLKKGKEWLDKMIALKIDHPLLHGTKALYRYEGERDYQGALAELNIIDKFFGNDKQTISLREYVLRRMGRLDEALKLFIRVAEARPKAGYAQQEVAETYVILRKADSALLYIDKALKLEPDNPFFYAFKASIYSDFLGDTKKPFEILKAARSIVDTTEFSKDYIYFEMLNGNYENALARLLARKDTLYQAGQTFITPNNTVAAYMYNAMGDPERAKNCFRKSLDIMLAHVAKYPRDFRGHAALGIAYAGLGERDKGIEEGNKARNLMSVSTDAIVGLGPLESLAVIYTLLGEQEMAIDMLEQLLKLPYGWNTTNTIPLYRTFPAWKPLHNNPRFQQMIR